MAEAALAAKAVGWAVSPLITKLSDSYLGGDVSAEKLRELRTITLPKIEMVIEAAETNPNAIGGLGPWLNDLRAAAFEAEDVLDEYDYKLLKKKVKKKNNTRCHNEEEDDQVSSLSFAWARSVSESCKKIPSKAKEFVSPLLPKTELAKSVEKLEKVASRVGEFIELLKLKTNPNLAGSSSTSALAKTQEVITTTSNPPLAVFGRDGECDSIVNLLITSAGDALGSSGSTSKVPIIAIYGIGGAGKTTVAQKLYNDSKVVQCFERNRMWVHVPRKFDTSRVAKEMMESLAGGATGDMLNLDALLEKLKENLKDKKFLLVLDDVWDEPKDEIQCRWDQLVGALNAVAVRGSRVLMTTRSEGVASMLGAKDRIRLKKLRSEDCLSIIEHYAFKDGLKFADFPGELREVGKQIVNRLKGSPLAARMVASNQLRQKSTVDAWRSISEGDLLNKSTVRDVLLSSFKHLPAHLQRCFAFCSLFSEGEEMDHDELVRLWMAEGFVDAREKNGSRAEDIGSRYCDELEYHSFFQRPPYSYGSRICYVIHDLLHDLAGDVSNGICYRIEGDDEPREIPLTVVHLSITHANLGIHLPNICKLVSLRTLIVMGGLETESAYLVKMLEKLKRLRVLDLGYASEFSELPSSVGHLKHLRYLPLGNTRVEQLPQSFSRLYHLQLLNLEYSRVESLPDGMNNLISLRHLIAKPDLVCSIPEIGKLASLQRLEEYRIGKDKQHGIGQLKTMRELRGSLRIKNLENVRDKAEASKAMLKGKKRLDKLALEWTDSDDRDGKSDEEVLEALEAYPSTLKELEISGNKGVRPPSWMTRNRSQCLDNLQSLKLFDCSNWELGAIEPPPHLKQLRINGNRGLGYPSWMSECQYLYHLEVLYLSDCSKWEVLPPLGRLPMLKGLMILHATGVSQIGPEFYGMDGGNSGGFPRLEDLYLRGMQSCEQWTGGSAAAFPSLPCVDIENWPELRHVSGLPHHVERIRIRGCRKLTEIPLLSQPGLEQLEIRNLPKLKQLSRLPHNLRRLAMGECPELAEIPLLSQPGLEELEIRGLPKLKQLSCLPHKPRPLDMGECPELTEISLSPLLSLEECPPAGIASLRTALKYVSIEECGDLRSMEGFEALPSLEELSIAHCSRLLMTMSEAAADPPQPLLPSSLRKLSIFRCHGVDRLPPGLLLGLTSLTKLGIRGCAHVRSLGDDLSHLASLERFIVLECPRFDGRLPSVKEILIVDDLSRLGLMQEQALASLPGLSIQGTTAITPEQEEMLLRLTSLKELGFYECPNLQALPDNLERLSSLTQLEIRSCPIIETLPNHLPAALKILDVSGCHPELERRYGESGPQRHKIQHIRKVKIVSM